MPIYEYACEQCGHQYELWQKITDAPVTDCPACGGSSAKRVISATSFSLKGGGWYATDYQRKGREEAEETTKGKASSACASGGG